jgi:alanine racemase
LPDLSSSAPRIEIDLKIVAENFARFQAIAPNTEISAVLKADAYGLGAVPVASVLAKQGCKSFWLARVEEAVALRPLLPDADLYVLDGPTEQELGLYESMALRPVLCTRLQAERWIEFAKGRSVQPAALHVETGLNRLALDDEDIDFCRRAYETGSLKLSLILSHLASSDVPASAQNRQQLDRFIAIRNRFPDLRASFSASYGFFLGPEYRFDMARMGRALYGIRKPGAAEFLSKPTLALCATVLSVRRLAKGMVGYNATWGCGEPRRLATLSIGYADGLLRSFQYKGRVFFRQGQAVYPAPVAGRISMDLMTCDVSQVPEDAVFEGATGWFAFGEQDMDLMADLAGTNSYELISRLSPRVKRIYNED